MRSRLAASVAVVLLAAPLLIALTGCFPDDSPRISIEFGAAPELFEGHDVLIDGKPVGKLERTGQATRISFAVKPGMHEVCIDVPNWTCVPARVDVEMKGQKVRLLAEPSDAPGGPDGKPQFGFRPI